MRKEVDEEGAMGGHEVLQREEVSGHGQALEAPKATPYNFCVAKA